MSLKENTAVRALLARVGVRQQQAELGRALLGKLFDKQQTFVLDQAREKGALCTRRAGKTTMWPVYCTLMALSRPRSIIRIWGINRLRAKQLLWEEFRELFRQFSIPAKFHDTELTITLSNRAEIRLLGADKDKEVQKKRGDKTWMEVVLESQLFGPFLKTLVDDVAGPCLFDLRGTFCLEGTPGSICAGHWFDVSGRNDTASRWTSAGGKEGVGAGWSLHRWSVLDNPFLPHAREELASIKKKRRWTDTSPTYVREWLGRWVNDLDSLFYRFDPVRNTFTLDEVQPWGPGWEHTLGWDLGFKDDMALVVWGYHQSRPELYEAFSWKKPGALSSEVMAEIQQLEARGFNFVKRVADTGGGGRAYVEDVMKRYSMTFEAAKKTDKYDHVRMMNDDFSGGFLRLQAGSAYAEEIAELARDQDWPPEDKPEAPPREDPRCANHCCFVAGTLVLTARGDVPIERLGVGDLVLTRAGWRPVVKTACTGIKPVVTWGGLTGTPEHPVWTENRGWTRLDSLAATDTVLCAWDKSALNWWSGVGKSGAAGQTPHDEATACTSGMRTGGSTARFGRPRTAPFRTPITCTTETGTQITTAWKTLSAFLARSICPSTPENGLRTQRFAQRLTRGLRKLVRRLLSGIGPPKDVSGTASMGALLWRSALSILAPAQFAERSSSQRTLGPLSAPTPAAPGSDARAGKTMWTARARSAAELSGQTSTASKSAARVVAPVFAVTVAECHEFVANGVLVSNCDAALYAFRGAFHYLHREEAPIPKRGEQRWYDQEVARIEAALAAQDERSRARHRELWNLEGSEDAEWTS